jgi:hypothetical protein
MSESGVLAGGRWVEAVEARPWGWFAAFVALALLIVVGMLLWWAVFGLWDTLFDPEQPLGISYDGRNHMTLGVLLAFVWSSTLWIRRGVQRDVRRLGESAGMARAEIAEALERNWRPAEPARLGMFVAALMLGFVIIPLTSAVGFAYAGWDMHHVWAIANHTAVFYLMFEGGWLAVESWGTIHRFMRRHLSVDLLDRQEIASIGRIGGRGALIWLGGCTIASSLTWGMERVAPLVTILSVLLAFATLSLLLPALMARGSLRDAKRSELERVREKIARARETVLEGAGPAVSEQAAVLQGLLAYEARIESVREWPYDPPTLIRFAVFAVIAAGSWLGGALVERALSALLD